MTHSDKALEEKIMKVLLINLILQALTHWMKFRMKTINILMTKATIGDFGF